MSFVFGAPVQQPEKPEKAEPAEKPVKLETKKPRKRK